MTKEQVQQIISLSCKKHIKIYKLNQLGIKKSEIATLLGTNAGHVYNALKKYEEKPELKEVADKVA